MAGRGNVYKMKAYSAVFLERKGDLADGDKIILHQDILDQLMRRFGRTALPHPIIFEIRNEQSGKISHCGVLEFSAPRKDAFLPAWMMRNMDLEDGEDISLKLKELPKATKLKFQPIEYKFVTIPDPKSTLEFALRKFTALTKGDTILLQYSGTDFHLKVLEVAPSSKDAVSIVNSSPSVEFESPKEEKPAEKEFITFALEAPATASLNEGEWGYYRFQIVDVHMALRFKLVCSKGEANLYVSTKTRPTTTAFSWSSTGLKENVVTIEPDHKEFSKSWYFVGIHAYKGRCEFVLSAQEVLPEAEKAAVEKAAPILGRLGSQDPDAKKCDTCDHYVPSKRYDMHVIQCARNNWKCPKCNAVIQKRKRDEHIHCPSCTVVVTSKAELDKHIELAHTAATCPQCNQSVDPALLTYHLEELCTRRLTACKYCKLKLSAEEIYAHENYCGSKSTPCEICDKPVSAKRMTNHLAAEHNYNPSLHPGQKGYRTVEELKLEWQARNLSGFGGGFGGGYGRGAGWSGSGDLISTLPASMEIEHLTGGRVRGSSRSYEPPSSDAQLQLALAASQASAANTEEEMLRRAIAESKGEPIPPSSTPSSASSSTSSSSSSRSFASTSYSSQPKDTAPPTSGGKNLNTNVIKCPYCDLAVPAFDDLITHMAICPKSIR